MVPLLRKYGFSLCMAVLIMVACAWPKVPSIVEETHLYATAYSNDEVRISYMDVRDFVAHMTVFAMLSYLLAFETYGAEERRFLFWSRKGWLFIFLLPVLYGGVVELVQEFFFPPRAAEWKDWFADGLGSLCAMLVVPWTVPFLYEKYQHLMCNVLKIKDK